MLNSHVEVIVPVAAPILAFTTYEYVASGFELFLDVFSNQKWIAVDGGALQAKVIAPATMVLSFQPLLSCMQHLLPQ